MKGSKYWILEEGEGGARCVSLETFFSVLLLCNCVFVV